MLQKLIEFLSKSEGKYKFPDYPSALNLLSNPQAGNWGPTIASATQITISYAIHKVSGTTSITTVRIPTGFRGMFVLVPTGAVPLTQGGVYVASDGTYEVIPFALTMTCVTNRAVMCVTDGLLIYCVGVVAS